MNNNINAILQNIVSTAAMAASEAKTAVRSAGKAVAEKYDEVKLNVELLRLTEQQEDVFSDIGRMLFLLHTGVVTDTVMSDAGEKTPQQVIDSLLVSAEQLQQEMDVITGRLTVECDQRICPECGRSCGGHDVFCAACGARLAEAAAAERPEPGAGGAAAEPSVEEPAPTSAPLPANTADANAAAAAQQAPAAEASDFSAGAADAGAQDAPKA